MEVLTGYLLSSKDFLFMFYFCMTNFSCDVFVTLEKKTSFT